MKKIINKLDRLGFWIIWNVKPLGWLYGKIMDHTPGGKELRDSIRHRSLWVIADDNKVIKVLYPDGTEAKLSTVKGSWKLKPSINNRKLNTLTLTLFVNIARSEEDMHRKIIQDKVYWIVDDGVRKNEDPSITAEKVNQAIMETPKPIVKTDLSNATRFENNSSFVN